MSIILSNAKSVKQLRILSMTVFIVLILVVSHSIASLGQTTSQQSPMRSIGADSFSNISRQTSILSIEGNYSDENNDLLDIYFGQTTSQQSPMRSIGADSFSNISRSLVNSNQTTPDSILPLQ